MGAGRWAPAHAALGGAPPSTQVNLRLGVSHPHPLIPPLVIRLFSAASSSRGKSCFCFWGGKNRNAEQQQEALEEQEESGWAAPSGFSSLLFPVDDDEGKDEKSSSRLHENLFILIPGVTKTKGASVGSLTTIDQQIVPFGGGLP